ncbi:hypothetical protein PTKIN_Ptkin12aG0091600 [Pterospermum kingtungense]
MRLSTRKMESCLWLVMCVGSQFAGLVMSMRGVKEPSAVHSATLATSVTKVVHNIIHFVISEFHFKNHKDDSDRHHENGDYYNNQQWHTDGEAFSVVGSNAGKDFEGDKEIYGGAEWEERLKKWKVGQRKRGLVSNNDGGNDQAEEEEDDYQL